MTTNQDPEKRDTHRSIRERVVVRGELVLLSPAHFGGAEADALTDMPILLNEVDGRPLLPGTSIAGALRNYLREYQAGDWVTVPKVDKEKTADQQSDDVKEERERAATLLFGGFRGDDDGEQSPLIVEDAVGTLNEFELRDGVAIESSTRTAKDDQKFDIQLLGAGTSFPLQFELVIREKDSREKLLQALVTALKGFEEKAITLGARKRRGFGKCQVTGWEVSFYDLKSKEGLLNWLASERGKEEKILSTLKPVEEALGVRKLPDDKRARATLKATFGIDGTLLIRSGFGDLDARADTVHLHATRKGSDGAAVIPGTSWAGILRHRALKIARTLSDDRPAGTAKVAIDFVDSLFGPSKIEEKKSFGEEKDPVKSSRISIEESEVKQAESLEITRVAIDRFTGGAYEGALFTEQPLVGNKNSEVDLVLNLRNPTDAEMGLLLLLLKDLWTGDLPIGSESGIGRGKLHGREANLHYDKKEWFIKENSNGSLQLPTDTNSLENFVVAFNKAMEGEK